MTKKFLGKYWVLIIAFIWLIYGVLVRLSIVHSIDFETIFYGMSALWIVEMFRIEYKLGELSGKKK